MKAPRLLTLVFAILSSLLLPSFASAGIDPRYKEALQRGYPMMGDSVILPDGSRCHVDDYNLGLCGLQFQVGDYCVEQGRYVWDEGKCCPGLVAWLPEGEDGQATCQKSSTVFWLKAAASPLVWGLGGLLAGGAIFMLARRRRMGLRK